MPVHTAGARLYRSVPFKHLVKKAGSGAEGRASNISLNLVPFVDMMTILVCFLLMVFSSSGQLLSAQKGLELPLALNKEALQLAPVIIVTGTDITYQGTLVATVESAKRDDSATFRIEALAEKLKETADKIKTQVDNGEIKDSAQRKACEDVKSGLKPKPGAFCPEGLAILQADKSTDARLINKIVNTAKSAGFDNLLFAVKNK
ncbi:MAG: ExbD/TolR family protein [Kofleriaceae bacterium]